MRDKLQFVPQSGFLFEFCEALSSQLACTVYWIFTRKKLIADASQCSSRRVHVDCGEYRLGKLLPVHLWTWLITFLSHTLSEKNVFMEPVRILSAISGTVLGLRSSQNLARFPILFYSSLRLSFANSKQHVTKYKFDRWSYSFLFCFCFHFQLQ